MATYTNFCCRAGGSNLNAGTLLGDTTLPGTAPSFAYNGTLTSHTFTITSGRQGGSTADPVADGVVVGMFAHVNDGSAMGRLARITSVTATTIVLHASQTIGNGAGAIVANIGGAFLGPNAASPFLSFYPSQFPINAASDPVKVHLKNDQTYSITTGITLASGDVANIEGFTDTYGDGGIATIDGGTVGASYILLSIDPSISPVRIRNINFKNNGATGSSSGVVCSANGQQLYRCVFQGMRGSGAAGSERATFIECEAFGNNLSNTTNLGGFSADGDYLRCISHSNTGTNTVGFYTVNGAVYRSCIAYSNGGDGFRSSSSSVPAAIINCDSYNNGSDGIQTSGAPVYIENTNLVKNVGAGINAATGQPIIRNCGYGSGTQANGLANVGNIDETGAVTYPADVTPWIDPANGDFTLNLAEAIGVGIGTFLQTAAGYTGTTSSPNIGATQSESSGGSSMTIARSRGALLGTSESVGISIASAGSTPGNEVDLLADDASYGTLAVYLVFTPLTAPSRGTIEVLLQTGRVTGVFYDDRTFERNVAGLGATQIKTLLGRFPAPRYIKATVNNKSDVTMNGIAVMYELEKIS